MKTELNSHNGLQKLRRLLDSEEELPTEEELALIDDEEKDDQITIPDEDLEEVKEEA